MIKKILNSIWNEFIYGGHLIGLGAISIVFAFSILLGIKITWDFLVVVYLGMYSGYLYNYYKELKLDFSLDSNLERIRHLKKYTKYIPMIIFLSAFLIILVMISLNKIPVLFLGLILFFLGLLYTVYFKKLTQKITVFKNFFVSLMWASLILFLIIYYSLPLNTSVFLILSFVFLRLFIHEVFSDIKDKKSDQERGLLTIPVIFKKKEIFYTLLFLNILSAIPIVMAYYLKLLPSYSMMLLLTIPYSFYCFRKPKNIFLIDGEYIFWSALILLGKILI